MSSNSESKVSAEFKDRLQQTLSCVTDRVLITRRSKQPLSTPPHTIALNNGLPVPLNIKPTLLLVVTQGYEVTKDTQGSGGWAIHTLEYIYSLRNDTTELLAYHWHPHGNSRAIWPHLHVYDPLLSQGSLLQKAHLPTARIALEDVIRLAIEEFGVHPRRNDWDSILINARKVFERERNWA